MLTEPGRTRPRKYCRDGEGGYEDSHGISCAELGPAKEKYERVFGREAIAGAAVEQLRGQLTAARDLVGPGSPLARLLTELGGTVNGVGEQLDTTVTEAIADTARATAAERDALGREAVAIAERDTSDDRAQDAVRALLDGERELTRKLKAAHDLVAEHEQARQRAEQDRAKADAERDLYKERAMRAEEAARRDRDQLTQADLQITALTTTVTELRTQLTTDAERARTELANVQAAAATARQQLRDELDGRLQQAQTEFADRLATAATAHSAEFRRLDRDHADNLDRQRQATTTAEHALQRRLGTLVGGVHQLIRAERRHADTDPDERLRELCTGLAELLSELDNPPPPTSPTTAPPGEG
jgi:DNA repair exonuclease SbcCD ATPase subunit